MELTLHSQKATAETEKLKGSANTWSQYNIISSSSRVISGTYTWCWATLLSCVSEISTKSTYDLTIQYGG